MAEHEYGYPGQFEQCDHVGCVANGARNEYCEKQALDLDGDIMTLADKIDQLFVHMDTSPDATVTYRASGGETMAQSEVTIYTEDHPDEETLPIETQVVMSRVTTRSSECATYIVTTKWSVVDLTGVQYPNYETTFTIEIWSQSAKATISEYDFQFFTDTDDKNKRVLLVDRPMTTYDFTALMELLVTVEATQIADTFESESD